MNGPVWGAFGLVVKIGRSSGRASGDPLELLDEDDDALPLDDDELRLLDVVGWLGGVSLVTVIAPPSSLHALLATAPAPATNMSAIAAA